MQVRFERDNFSMGFKNAVGMKLLICLIWHDTYINTIAGKIYRVSILGFEVPIMESETNLQVTSGISTVGVQMNLVRNYR